MKVGTIIAAILFLVFVGATAFTFLRSWTLKSEVTPMAVGNSFAPQQKDTSSAVILREGEVVEPSPSSTIEPSESAKVVVKNVRISISDTDFSPAVINITPGTTVTFINNGQGMHWPESSEFDAQHGMQTGETFSYEFKKPGKFEYKDHLNAKLTGTIIVK